MGCVDVFEDGIAVLVAAEVSLCVFDQNVTDVKFINIAQYRQRLLEKILRLSNAHVTANRVRVKCSVAIMTFAAVAIQTSAPVMVVMVV